MVSHAREDFADLHAGDVGRRRSEWAAYLRGGAGLGVPGVDMARAADQEQHDAVDVAVGRLALRLSGIVIAERQAQRGDRAGVQKVAARHAVAETRGPAGIES